MLISHWFRRGRRPTATFRPAVVQLEDRTVPSGISRLVGRILPPGPATHLQLIVPESVQSGQSFDVLVAALDGGNHVATGYTGSVSLSLRTADAGANLPGAFNFSAQDHGVHIFHVTLAAAVSQTIIATDGANSSISGSAVTVVTPVPALTQFQVVTQEQVAVGVPSAVTVLAVDQSGRVLRDFNGTVNLVTSDAKATGLPATYTFLPGDHGGHIFQVTFNSTGPQTVTAASGAAHGQASLTVYDASVVTHFGFRFDRPPVVGVATPVVVVALNAANQVMTGYTGAVTLSSTTDPTATATATAGGAATTLPLTYTFQASDKGRHTFWVTFDKSGQQTLTVTDLATSFASTATVYVFATPVRRSPNL
jgi:hypothetical protein